MDVCAYQQDNWSGQAPGFFPILNLDYDRVISQWGEGSVFSSNNLSIEEFTTGDFLLDLDGIDELSAFGLFDCDERSQSPAQPAPCATPPQLFSAVAPPKLVACCPTTFDSSSSPVNHCFDNWRCAPDLYVKKEPGFSSPFSTSSACLSNSSESCIVPDTVQSSATSAGALPLGNSYGIVPQPSRFMCSMPNPPPTMQAVLPLEPPSELVRLRQECLQRYRDKKARRMYTKMIRYRLRKINADKRPRIKGRFVKKEIQQGVAAAILSECMAGSDSVQGDECMSDDSL